MKSFEHFTEPPENTRAKKVEAENPGGGNAHLDHLRIRLRPYQREAFENRSNGIEVWLWGRQTGKSFTLAAWAVDRLIHNPGRLVTILSNSRQNGAELNRKCAEVCRLYQQAFEQLDLAPDARFETMNYETRITLHGLVSRIKVLAPNPLTARSFSGDLILDEFAFVENAAAVWDAAEPILAANKDYLCRIASTPNGKHNQFYRLATDPAIPLRKITRTDAWKQGCAVYHPITRAEITPEQARALASNKRAYDQNYECVFENENMALLTHELICAAERPEIAHICEQSWTSQALSFLLQIQPSSIDSPVVPPSGAASKNRSSRGNEALTHSENPPRDSSNLQTSAVNENPPSDSASSAPSMLDSNPFFPDSVLSPQSSELKLLYAGIDVGRHRDQTVITVLEKIGSTHLVRAILRLQNVRFPDQQKSLESILALPNLVHAKIDATGLGVGLYEYTQQKFPRKITGLNFGQTVPLSGPAPSLPSINSVSSVIIPDLSNRPSVRVTEFLATQLLQAFEDRSIQIPIDQTLRDDLRKPERLVSPSGRVSIAATRDSTGHADHFWSLALALDAAKGPPKERPTYLKVIRRFKRPFFNTRKNGLTF